MTEVNDFSKFKKLSNIFNSGKSMSEILEEFRCISKDYTEYKETEDKSSKYSNINYKYCTNEEQQYFINNELYNVNCLVINSIYEKSGLTWNWSDIFNLLSDSLYKSTEKINRKLIYPTSTNSRPIGEISYQLWNGLQIIDLDIKNTEITELLKPILFKELSKYHWFLGCTKSASGKGLHLWTKITPLSVKADQRKIEYLCNFRHKYSYVYMVLLTYMNEIGYTKNNILSYIDMAMAKPQQGIFISSDDNAMMSTNFSDERLDVNFETAFNTGVESIDWISHPDLKNIFSKLEWFNNDTFTENTDIKYEDITIKDRDAAKNIRKHYKHAQRWQLANTLTSLFGADKALLYLVEVCKGTDKRELAADIKTASIHNKPISSWAVKELNDYHGFNIEVKTDEQTLALDKIAETVKNNPLVDASAEVNKISQKIELKITAKQYLSDIKDDILNNLGHISLLEAGAGYGKTEMVKSFGGKTLLILPFTSTIKAKVEASEVTKNWLYYYGNKRPTLDELLSDHSMSMTIDKFSRLNIYELDQAQFDYIVIDESHLLFTSSYRSVMAPCIQRLANCKAKVIMMTGTPTGELVFFPNIKYIKVIKEDNRDKTFDVHFCNKKMEVLIEMAKGMAQDIIDGKKVLFPTNNGNLYFHQITGLVQEYVNKLTPIPKEVTSFYYKKSNYGDDSMENININKTIGVNDIILCTTYLSVGVDICDDYKFSIYFNEPMIAQDIEQFANRIRNNDLHIKLFLPKYDEDGFPYKYDVVNRPNYEINTAELMLAKNFLQTVNDVIERNEEESKYNPFIQKMLGANQYLKYDENECKYFIDETYYKLKIYEERYSEYATQLKVILNNISKFGYETDIVNHTSVVDDDRRGEIEEYIKRLRTEKYNKDTENTKKLLENIDDNNIDLYKELLKGNYSFFKDDCYKEDRQNNNIYVADIELMEKNLPIILSFYKYYDCEVIKDIYEYCIDKKSNRINYSKLERIRTFANIEFARRKKRLDFPVLKFIRDSQAWAITHFITTKEEIDEYLREWTVKYVNSIRDLIVDDVTYLEEMYETIQEFWKIIIVQSRSKKKNIQISPFSLMWETKESIDNIYGNSATREFFAEELLDNMHEEEDEEIPEFKHTAKYKLEQIERQLPNVIHAGMDYYDYSEKDGSNERFLRKQENTNKLHLNNNQEETTTTPDPSGQLTFEFDDVPF